MFSDDWRDGNGKYARTHERETMTVAGCVQFKEVWRVKIEYARSVGTGPYEWETDVAAESMSGAIASAIAFFNRGRTDFERISPENVTGVARSTLEVSLLVPTMVEALHYPDVEVAARVTERTKATMVDQPTMAEMQHPHPPGCFCTDCMPTRYTNTQQPELPIHDEHAPLPTGPLISRGAIARDQRNDATRGFTNRATTDDDGIEK